VIDTWSFIAEAREVAAQDAAAPEPGSPAAKMAEDHERACVILRDAGWAVTTAARSDSVPAVWERLRTDEHVLTVAKR
jgi:hypothetical protein